MGCKVYLHKVSTKTGKVIDGEVRHFTPTGLTHTAFAARQLATKNSRVQVELVCDSFPRGVRLASCSQKRCDFDPMVVGFSIYDPGVNSPLAGRRRGGRRRGRRRWRR